jgi:F-type H+-transporting ATPase subunit delta
VATASGRRYARAIFELASEQKEVDAWAKRLTAVRELLENPDVRRLVANPSVAPQRRLEALAAVADRRLDQEGLNLARLLVESHRVDSVATIAAEFARLADAAAGRLRATATTAVELSAQDRARISRELTARFGREVGLEVRVDPAILGGLVLEVGDHVIDASVATRLQQLRRALVAS